LYFEGLEKLFDLVGGVWGLVAICLYFAGLHELFEPVGGFR